MADDDAEEKTLPPSQLKLARLRREGSVAHSKDVVSLSPALLVMIYLAFGWPSLLGTLWKSFDFIISAAARPDLANPTAILMQLAVITLETFSLIFAIALGAVALSGVLDSGGIVASFKSLSPKFERINPFEGLKRLFKLESFVELGKALFKATVILTLIWIVLKNSLNALLWAPLCGETCILPLVIRVLTYVVGFCSTVLILVAIVDLPLSRILFRRENKMTPSEAKREMKEIYGDPHVRQARRRAHFE